MEEIITIQEAGNPEYFKINILTKINDKLGSRQTNKEVFIPIVKLQDLIDSLNIYKIQKRNGLI